MNLTIKSDSYFSKNIQVKRIAKHKNEKGRNKNQIIIALKKLTIMNSMISMDTKIHIFYGAFASSMERLACEDLKIDLENTTNLIVENKEENQKYELDGLIIIVGSIESNSIIAQNSAKGIIPITKDKPGKRGGCIHVIDRENKLPIIMLAGSDSQGAQYMVYDFSRYILGVDPFNFWTGYKPKTIESIEDLKKIIQSYGSKIIEPPLVPILCYFDNDNDELANMEKPFLEFSFEHWKQIIDSLVRLRYNAIDLHDHLGRAEFYRWKHYKKLVPNYYPNIELLNNVIEYGHQKGMLFQVSFYLGWKFKTITDKANKNYEKFKNEWFTVWKYYLENTPIGKCDIFLNRPRDQKWDRRYKGADYPKTAILFNEIFHEMRNILKEHNPDSIIIIDLYSEGRHVYREGLEPQPKEDFIMAWPDDGFGGFEYMPDDLRNYKFGIYMHAGYYRNHVVMDPYPELLEQEMRKGLVEYGMDSYCLVNGQTFRHYILNLEACSDICNKPDEFDAEKFYLSWSERYFGSKVKNEIIEMLKILHNSQIDRRTGYIDLMSTITISIMLKVKLIKFLRFIPKSTIIKIFDKFDGKKSSKEYLSQLEQNAEKLKIALDLGEKVLEQVEDQVNFFHDHIFLPIKLLFQLNLLTIELIYSVNEDSKKDKKHLIRAIEIFKEHHDTRLKGDKNKYWKTWYDPEKRRPNGGYPDLKSLEKLI